MSVDVEFSTDLRYFETDTGRCQHIVREVAYHGSIIGPPSMCGHHAHRPKDVVEQRSSKPLCKTCEKLRKNGAR